MEKIKRCSRTFMLLCLSFIFFDSLFIGTTFAAPADFPQKEITIIVNLGPGGSRDILARGLGNTMSKYLGVPVVVINTPGAGGARGLISLYHAAPDGYTIGVGMGADTIDQIFEKRDYDNRKFTYLGRVQVAPSFIFVKSDSPFRSIKDFKTFGKPLRQSAFMVTGNTAVISMVVANREDFPMAIVGGYPSAQATTLALIRGEVEFTCILMSVAKSFVQAGQIRPILTIDSKRFPEFPDIQTLEEIGHGDLLVLKPDTWFMAPPGVPKDRAQILENALMKTLKDPEFLSWAKKANIDIGPLSGEETSKIVFNLFGVLEKYRGDIGKYVKK